jgi:hypothetical protein
MGFAPGGYPWKGFLAHPFERMIAIKQLEFLSRQQATGYYGIPAPTLGLRHALAVNYLIFDPSPLQAEGNSN